MAERKRQCKREDSSDTHVASEDDEPFYVTDEFLATSMRILISDHLESHLMMYADGLREDANNAEEAFAERIHCAVLEEWDGAVDEWSSDALKRKAETWSKDKKARRMPSPELGGDSGGAQRDGTAGTSVTIGQ
jgi:hypothetical protein